MSWIFENREFKELQDFPKGSFGFVYRITHIPSGKMYIGRKNLMSITNVKLGKKETALIKEERKVKGMRGRVPLRKKVVKESNWKDYYSSNKIIKALIKEGKEKDFKREIIYISMDKKLLTYYETKHLFVEEVLENNDKYFNDNIGGTYYSKNFD